jgi:hypothetical protein
LKATSRFFLSLSLYQVRQSGHLVKGAKKVLVLPAALVHELFMPRRIDNGAIQIDLYFEESGSNLSVEIQS